MKPAPTRHSPAWAFALWGAGLGVAVFAIEALSLVQTGALRVHEQERVFSALLQAVRPELPGLFARVAVAYVLAGGLWGAVAGLLTVLVISPDRRWWWRAIFGLELLVLGALVVTDRAIARPALLDLSWMSSLVRWAVEQGEPLQVRAVAGGWLLAHLALAWRARRRLRARRLGLAGLAAGAALALLATQALPSAPSEGKGRLVVLFGIDALRPDRLRAFGGDGRVTPNLDAMARDAVNFRAAYTPIAQTEPAWRSLVTARWPFETGVRTPLTPEDELVPLPTFPEAMSRAGYRTIFRTDCSRFNFLDERSGFGVRRQPPRGALNFALERMRFRGLGLFADNALGAWWLPEYVDNRALAGIHDPIGYAQRLAAEVGAEARRGPLLYAFHATAAHFPGDPVFPHYRRFVPASLPVERRIRMSFAPITAGKSGSPEWGQAASEALYDELLAQADQQLGIVLERLKEDGLYDDALIVVFSDHGESFHADVPSIQGSTPLHGSRLQEVENRVALVVKLPRGAPGERGTVASELVRLIDVGPTLLDVLGLPPLPGADGVSLAPLLRGEGLPERLRLYAETGFTHASPDVFDPLHRVGAPRTFDAYRVHPDGLVEMAPGAFAGAVAEKDIGAFDARSWLIRSPRRDGAPVERCLGECEESGLRAWLDSLTEKDDDRAKSAGTARSP